MGTVEREFIFLKIQIGTAMPEKFEHSA